MMTKKGVFKHAHKGESYLPLVDYQAWRVAMLCRDDTLTPETITFLERHNGSDEVFVLLGGSCLLIWTTQDQPGVEDLRAETLEPGIVYNVACGTWHSTALTEEAQVLIVENADTDDSNSQYACLSQEQRTMLKKLAAQCNYPLRKEEMQ